MNKRLTKQIAFFAVITFIMVFLAELVCRHRFPYDMALVRDPDHRLEANTAETNSDGIRSDSEAAVFEEDDLNIIFLGDSFVYGLGQRRELSFPQQYERLVRARYPGCRINVANFGWVSSSPYLSLRLLEDIGAKYSPDVVFLFLDMTDFHDDLKYEYLIERPTLMYKALSVLPGITILVKKVMARLDGLHGLHEAVFRLPADRFFIVNQPLSESEDHGSTVFRNIGEIADFSERDLDAKFVLVAYPRSFQYSGRESPENWEKGEYEALGPYSLEPFALIERFKQRAGFPVYSLLGDFQTTEVFPTVQYDDPHWTEKGHRLVAEKTYVISQEEGLISCDGFSQSDADATTLDPQH